MMENGKRGTWIAPEEAVEQVRRAFKGAIDGMEKSMAAMKSSLPSRRGNFALQTPPDEWTSGPVDLCYFATIPDARAGIEALVSLGQEGWRLYRIVDRLGEVVESRNRSRG